MRANSGHCKIKNLLITVVILQDKMCFNALQRLPRNSQKKVTKSLNLASNELRLRDTQEVPQKL